MSFRNCGKEDVGKVISYGKLSIPYTVEAVFRPNELFDNLCYITVCVVCSVFLTVFTTHCHSSWSNKTPMPPKRILNVDSPHLPKCTKFLHRF